MSSALNILRRERDILSNLEEHQVAAIIEVMKQSSRLAGDFLPQRFDGDVLLFAATQGDAPPLADSWKSYVNGKIIVHQVDCEHVHMMRPNSLAKIGLVLASEFDKQFRTRQ